MAVEVDREFAISWPFGVLKTLHVAGPFATLVTIYLGPFKYASVGFVQFVAWAFFFASLIYWLFYLFGVQRKSLAVGQAAIAFIPLALTDFIISCFGTVLFAVSTLICVISMISSFQYKAALVITYFFASAFTLISALAFGYYAILIYRAMPNGNWRNLQFLIVNGKSISVHPASGIPASNSTTSATNSANNPNRGASYVV